ncbi:inositol monophosphatase [Kosakonia sp. ML.JS2a]|uniref:inositol monophosphatase family protein n=1 Tax=Kosakonia sp. ML.JS2a TaxID=2980557 RepID=UPI0021D9F4A2|nr:inositol monophosphatase [Kosakonia sp. ML.JS2a]UXY10641.1 inositol monophosphatase [Kosakonia sp. ML.JS2a]
MTEQFTHALCALIRRLGQEAKQLRDSGLTIEQKGRQDFVSQADVYVETALRAWLKAQRPQDGLLGEERGLEPGSEGVWVIDPIDGTTNFILGMDYWCISVAYVSGNHIELGVIYAPDREEFFFAERGKGAFLNDQKLTITDPEPDAIVLGLGRSSRTAPRDYTRIIETLFEHGVEHRRFGAGALMLAHVAAGQVHGYFEAHLHSWDALAGLAIIKEAGGRHNDFLANNGLTQGNNAWAASPAVWQRLQPILLPDN